MGKKKKRGTLVLAHPPGATTMLRDGIVSSVFWPSGMPPGTRVNLAYIIAQILGPLRAELVLHAQMLDKLAPLAPRAQSAGEEAVEEEEEEEAAAVVPVVPAVPDVSAVPEEPAAPAVHKLDQVSVAMLPAEVPSATATDTMSVRSSEWLAGDWAAKRGIDDVALDTARLDKIVEDAVSRVERSATSMIEKVGKVLEGQTLSRAIRASSSNDGFGEPCGVQYPGEPAMRRPVSRGAGHASSSKEHTQLRMVQHAQKVAARSRSHSPSPNIPVLLQSTGRVVHMAWPEMEAHLNSNRMRKDPNGNFVYFDNMPLAS